ncbi:phage tail length tape measure family protein [Brevundimonas faecalis]|uniref:Bacteriophage tail tape measure N-terminal domain-containing protein n=1 Tax=Brevundimonas faecalis TaxID=947378 RepID=A0ABV2RE76_9CAUL
MADSGRDVKLVVKAEDNTAPGLRKAEAALQRFASAAQKAQARRAARSTADAAVAKAAADYERATAEATKFGRQLKQIENFQWTNEVVEAPERLAENFERAREEARRTKIELEQARAGVARFTQSGNGLATLEGRMASMATETARTDGAVDQLAAGLTRLNGVQSTAAARANATAGALRNQARAGDLASKITNAYSTRQGRGPLGLRPYELQNLGYQVNDLITQIASGTSPMQAFAQQGGQIAQIFPKATGAIIRFIPVIALAGAALAPFISAMNRANTEASRLTNVERILSTSGNAAQYSAPRLAAFAARLEEIGATADEAMAITRDAVRRAVDPAYLDRFAKAAGDMAKVLKVDVKTAAEDVMKAFTGNADAVLALDDELGFLTEAERKHIEQLRESKKDAEARTQAFDIFAKKYGDTAAQMKGPWSQILADFGAAWRSFVDWVNFIDWTKAKAEINALLSLVQELTSALPGARARTVDVVADDVAKAYGRVMQNEATKARLLAQGNRMGAAQIDRSIQQDRGVIALGETRLAGMSLINGTSELTRPRPVADTTTRPPAAANRNAGRGAGDAERKAKTQSSFLASLLAENDARAFQISLLDEAERQQLVLIALREKERAAAEAGLTLTAAQRQAITDGVTRLYDEQKAREAIKTIDQARLELTKARGEVETRDAYVQRQLAAQMVGATEEQRRVYGEILGQMYDIEESKRRQVELEKGVSDLEAQRAELQRQILFAQETGNESGAERLQEQLTAVNTQLLTAIDNMLAFWRATGGPEAQAAILALEGARDRVRGIGGTSVVTGKQINDAFAGQAASAIDRFSQNLAETGDLFGSLKDAFLQFAADFLRQIAMMIIQQIILNAVSGGTAGGGGAGGAGGFVAKLFGSKHTGGLVGHGGGFRAVNPAVFADAQRYHSGGLVGNEVPIIAKRNEEVLTEDDPRHRFNGGGAAQGIINKIINVLDPGDVMEASLATERGEKSFLNFITRNASAVKAVIG